MSEAHTKEGASAPSDGLAFLCKRRDGSLAVYVDGVGPFFTNRATRRSFTGVEHRHDGSKKPTRGRMRGEGWRGAKPKPKPKPGPHPKPRPY